jgi:tripartite-type tricarboxylate transporter receptor subunit TctC
VTNESRSAALTRLPRSPRRLRIALHWSAAKLCRLLATTCVAFATAVAFPALAEYPERPVRLIVPFPPGGLNDIASRLIANQLNTLWGRALIIDNRGGAGGNVGAEIAAKANPDGYTLFVVSTTIASNAALYSKLAYDLRRDFAPVSMLVSGAYVLVVNSAVPASSVQQLIQLAKAQPRKLNFSSFGEGGSAHLTGELFKRLTGVEMVHVPYKGGGPALAAVMSGEVQLTFANLSVALPQIKAAKVKALAVTSKNRKDVLPDTPSLEEIGLKGFDATSWVGLLAPAKTPRSVIMKLNRDVRTVLSNPDVRRQLDAQTLEGVPSTPEELAKHIAAEIERWGRVAREAGVRLDG